MKLIKTTFNGVLILEPVIHRDGRGYFYESWNQKVFEEAGLDYTWVQDNQAKSIYGTVRGIHYQKGRDAQTKLVRALQGRVLDIVVDLRKGASTYGQYAAVELSEDNHRQLLIPKGFGHGYSVLSDTALIVYKCDEYYAPEAEGAISAYDSLLGIDWQIDKDRALMSSKDTKAQSFADYSKNPDFMYSKQR